ncbi:MAG TPA: UbiA-like polyprenyltransferase [Candidatus Saccharimonadales bacterium]|nr:UbiA-like polyprenyltransferase [Candidatus Saccharimonadales bacterium]
MLRKLRLSAELVVFQHTIFALPFAFMGMLLAARGLPSAKVFVLIVVAMVGARTAAMSFNRLTDERYDRRNPRTAGRPLPSGRLSRTWAIGLCVASSALFVLAAAGLNPLCLYLSPLALGLILSYSLTKRFSALTHVHLGASLGLAPVGAWIAVTGRPAFAPVILGVAVCLWTAGFDIIYACQDVGFDRGAGLHSLPARLGVPSALKISAVLHALMVITLAILPFATRLGVAYVLGVVAVAVILVVEHRLVRPDDLSRVNAAFFAANGWISVGLLAATILDLVVAGGWWLQPSM